MTCEQCLCQFVCGPSYLKEMYANKAEKCPYIINKAVVVPVVRCKDCKCCERCYPAKAIGEEAIEGWYCKIRKKHMRPDDFCSNGERRNT